VLLDAVARPARVCNIGWDLQPIDGVYSATLATLLTLADNDTPVCLIGAGKLALGAYLRFHCGCRVVEDPKDAAFGLICDPALASRAFGFPIGSDEYPDRSATVILQVTSLAGGPTRTIKGPGIRSAVKFAPIVPADFWTAWCANARLYPCGIDIIFTCGNQLAALPRSSRLEG